MANENLKNFGPSQSFLLSEVLKNAVRRMVGGKPQKLGKLRDFIIEEAGPLPHVVGVIVHPGFGAPELLLPIEAVETIDRSGTTVLVNAPAQYARPIPENALLPGDYVLDKKVIDLEGREISVVFDVKLLRIGSTRKVYLTDVEFGKRGLYRRLGLTWLANSIKEDDFVSWSYIQTLPETIGSFKGDVQLTALKENINDMPPVDVADIIEELDSEHRAAVFQELDEESASDALEEIEPSVQRQLISELDTDTVARLIHLMTPAQADDVMAGFTTF